MTHVVLQCSASACSHDMEQVEEELADYIIPYVEAFTSGEEVTCYCNEEIGEERKSLMEQAWCDLKEGLGNMMGGHKEEKEGRRRVKRQADMLMEPIVASKKYHSCATVLSVALPMLFAGEYCFCI